ncbi:MAG: ABC transporter permease subunit [Acidimicrobiales bacterium]
MPRRGDRQRDGIDGDRPVNGSSIASSSGGTMLLAAVVGHHHQRAPFLAILVLVVLVVGGVVVVQRRRDRRPLNDAPSPRTYEEPLPVPTDGQRAVASSGSTAPRSTDLAARRGGHLSTTMRSERVSVKLDEAMPPGRYGISGLLRSEWTKLRSVRSTMWTLGITIVLGIGVSVLATAETRAHWLTTSPASRQGFDPISTSLVGVFIGQFAIGVLGVLVMSAEYGTGTMRATLSAAPRRPLVLVAKVIVFGVVALVVAEVVSFLAFFVGQALLTAPAPHATLGSPGAWRAVVGSGLYVGVLGLFSLGLATIIRHTAGAISAFVGVLLVLPLIVQALPSSIKFDVRRFLPDRIGAQILNGPANGFPGAFSPWIGLLVLCGYAMAVLVIGGVLLVRRDA